MTTAEARALAAAIERDAFSYVRSVLQATDARGRPVIEVVDLLTTQRHQVASPAAWRALQERLRGRARGLAHDGPGPGQPLAPLIAAAEPAAGEDLGPIFVAFVQRAIKLAGQRATDLRTKRDTLTNQIATAEREAQALGDALVAFEAACRAAPTPGRDQPDRRRRRQPHPPGVGLFPARWEPLARVYAATHEGQIDVAALAAAQHAPPSRVEQPLRRMLTRGQVERIGEGQYRLLDTTPPPPAPTGDQSRREAGFPDGTSV